METVLEKVQQHYRVKGLSESRTVLLGATAQYTLAEVVERVGDVVAFLQKQGVKRLALYAANSPEWVIADLACQEAGICLLPLPPFFSNSQLHHCLQEAGVDALLSDSSLPVGLLSAVRGRAIVEESTGLSLWRVVAQDEAQIPEGTSKITFTSGSTGTPKGVCLDVGIQIEVSGSLAKAIGIADAKHLCLLPLGTLLENVGGVYQTLLSGGCVEFLPADSLGFSGTGLDAARLLASIEQVKPDTIILLPEILKSLVQACDSGWLAPQSLQFMAVGGAKVSPALIRAARCHGLPVYEGYGLSECGSVVSLNSRSADRIGSCGTPLPHHQVEISQGEVIVSGHLFLGYLNDPQSWYPQQLATGDLARLDRDGFLQIEGRRKNLLISSFGRNINPEWIESEILINPAITQCVVVGDARPFCTALIFAAPEQATDKDIQQWLDRTNHQLPDYAQIRRWLRLPHPMDSQRGLWTANNRPRRDAIAHHFAREIDQLYTLHAIHPAQETRP